MKKNLVLLLIIIIFNSCASILNTRYQKVSIITQKENEILIDGKKPDINKGKIKLKRDAKPKQITISNETYKDDNYVIMQNKKSPLYILSVVPFGILFYTITSDAFPKAYDFPKKIEAYSREVKLIKKKDSYKNIHLNKISVDVKPEDLKVKTQNYTQYLEKSDKFQEIDIPKNEGVQYKNTFFVNLLNETLAENGFIDTTRKVLKGSFMNNLAINATVKKIAFNEISPCYRLKKYYNNTLIFSKVLINWEVVDFYNQTIYSKETNEVSGFFIRNTSDTIWRHTIKDAIEYNFLEFMSSDDVIKLLEDNSQVEIEKEMDVMKIPLAKSYVTDIRSAVKACLTIRTKKGHGSGFFISNEGHIITNYHVVSDTTNLTVILNNGQEFVAKILRTSKIHDLALLKIETNNEFAFNLSKQKDFEIASEIYAIGTPTAEDLSQTLSRGIISGFRNLGENKSLIQTDASINAGNSGGVVTDKEGNVAGVVSSKLNGFGIEGVAFCIPVKEVITSLKLKIK